MPAKIYLQNGMRLLLWAFILNYASSHQQTLDFLTITYIEDSETFTRFHATNGRLHLILALWCKSFGDKGLKKHFMKLPV